MNDESRAHGGGANYHTDAFGPLGAEQAPGALRPFTDSQGRRFDADGPYKPNRFTGRFEPTVRQVGGPQGRVGKGKREGGQFTSKHHGESAVRLI